MRFRTRTAAAVAGGLVMVGSLGASPALAAPPAPSCWGAECRDKDPSETICADDAVTLYSREAVTESGSWGVLDMRYSATCHSNWVRFTPWNGIRAWLGNAAAGAEVAGKPWIWREGVDEAPRGFAGQSSLTNPQVSYWTAMVDASGRTCMSVDVYEMEFSQSGSPWDWDPEPSQGGHNDLGNYTAGCFS